MCLGNEGKETVEECDHEVSNSLEEIREEGEGWSEVVPNARDSVLVGKGDQGVDRTVHIIGNSDLVASDKTKDFHELCWAVQEDKSGHVGNHSSQLEGISDETTNHD